MELGEDNIEIDGPRSRRGRRLRTVCALQHFSNGVVTARSPGLNCNSL